MKAKNLMKRKRMKAALRQRRVRARIRGTADQPRLSVSRSLKHLYAQVINDLSGRTLASASDQDVKAKGKPTDIAREVGKVLAQRAKEKGVERVAFDRGRYRFHGRVAALAQGAREGGLKF